MVPVYNSPTVILNVKNSEEYDDVNPRHVARAPPVNATMLLILMLKQIQSEEDVLYSFLYPRSTNEKGRTEISALPPVEEDVDDH